MDIQIVPASFVKTAVDRAEQHGFELHKSLMQRFFSVVNTLVLLDALLVDSTDAKAHFQLLGGQVPNPHVIQSLTVFY